MMTVVAALLAAALLAEAAAAQRPRPGARPPAARVADRWHVETSRSEMTDEPSVTLSLNATNTVEGVISTSAATSRRWSSTFTAGRCWMAT